MFGQDAAALLTEPAKPAAKPVAKLEVEFGRKAGRR
jgi:hypothetical protein